MPSATFSVLAATDAAGLGLASDGVSVPPATFTRIMTNHELGYFNPYNNGMGFDATEGGSGGDTGLIILNGTSVAATYMETGFIRFNTSSIGAGATLTAGTISFNVRARAGSSLLIGGDWLSSGWNGGLPSITDLPDTGVLANTAFLSTLDLSAPPFTMTLPLTNLGSINKTGYTRLRIAMAMPYPVPGSNVNQYYILSGYGDGVVPPPSISLTWTAAPSLPPLCMPRP